MDPDHSDTLAARSNLAAWALEAGDTAAARDQFAALLPIQERVLGLEHPDTLATRADLARRTEQAKNADPLCVVAAYHAAVMTAIGFPVYAPVYRIVSLGSTRRADPGNRAA